MNRRVVAFEPAVEAQEFFLIEPADSDVGLRRDVGRGIVDEAKRRCRCAAVICHNVVGKPIIHMIRTGENIPFDVIRAIAFSITLVMDGCDVDIWRRGQNPLTRCGPGDWLRLRSAAALQQARKAVHGTSNRLAKP
jgi:hypothetical protein